MGVKHLGTVTKAWSEGLRLCIAHSPDGGFGTWRDSHAGPALPGAIACTFDAGETMGNQGAPLQVFGQSPCAFLSPAVGPGDHALETSGRRALGLL